MQTITDLWYGNLALCDRCGAYDPEAKRILLLLERNRNALCASLTANQAEVFQKYMDCTESYLFRMMELAFADGFSLGSKLAMESLL